jgi:hypothetical protein
VGVLVAAIDEIEHGAQRATDTKAGGGGEQVKLWWLAVGCRAFARTQVGGPATVTNHTAPSPLRPHPAALRVQPAKPSCWLLAGPCRWISFNRHGVGSSPLRYGRRYGSQARQTSCEWSRVSGSPWHCFVRAGAHLSPAMAVICAALCLAETTQLQRLNAIRWWWVGVDGRYAGTGVMHRQDHGRFGRGRLAGGSR